MHQSMASFSFKSSALFRSAIKSANKVAIRRLSEGPAAWHSHSDRSSPSVSSKEAKAADRFDALLGKQTSSEISKSCTLSVAVDLLKQLKDRMSHDEVAMASVFDEVFWSIAEQTHRLQMGLDLLQFIKNDLGLAPSRNVLDALLSACVMEKDLDKSLLIWKEYEAAGLRYNIMSFLRMHQVLLASGHLKSAGILRRKIPKNDRYVRLIIRESIRAYTKVASANKDIEKPKNNPKNDQHVRLIIRESIKAY